MNVTFCVNKVGGYITVKDLELYLLGFGVGLNPMTGMLMKRKEWNIWDTREEGCMKTEAEIGCHLCAMDCLQPPKTDRETRTGLLLRSFRRDQL